MPDTLETTAPSGYLDLDPSVAEYLNELLSVIQENLWDSNEVDWERTRARLFTFADGADTTSDAYLAIRVILQEIDRHAFLMTPEEIEDFESGGEDWEPIVVDQPEPHLGLVVVPGYGGDSGPLADEWAASAQRAIAEVAPEVCGWIVDLRSNTGGNMWPMLAALGPLLDGGLVGAFTAPDATSTPGATRMVSPTRVTVPSRPLGNRHPIWVRCRWRF